MLVNKLNAEKRKRDNIATERLREEERKQLEAKLAVIKAEREARE
jgi:hypothetical protein